MSTPIKTSSVSAPPNVLPSERIGPGLNLRFQVVLDGKVDLGFWKSCKGLSVQFVSKEFYEGGTYDVPAAILPENLKYTPVTLERAVTEHGSARVQQWLSEMASKWMNNRYCDYGGGTAAITLADAALNPVAKWELRGVYPSKWTGPDLDAMGSGGVALERLELVHSGFLS
ncbi:phage tail protein [Streptomyces sp. NPDC047028]|uniref:phage tail protein n=1 Tax=Streptomyces sp. NPDC047028 TaxID=3155793 RepID=UPI0033E71316